MSEFDKLFSYTFEVISGIFTRDIKGSHVFFATLILCVIMTVYEFVVYRLVSHKSLYNKSFQILILVLPVFMGSIVFSQQANSVLTLGTIGALAIIRFRTVVKDPVDMLYLLWSVFIGLCSGCQLFFVCVLTSIIVTIILVMVDIFDGRFIRKSFCLVLNCNNNNESKINGIIAKYTKNYRLKSRSFSLKEVNYVYEILIKDPEELINELSCSDEISKFSLLEYDSEDII